MARQKGKRSYGTGSVIEKPNGLAIRWREPELMPDGSIRSVLKYKSLGAVSKREASQALQDRLAACQTPRRGPITFQELASVWKSTVLPMYKYSTQKNYAEFLEKKVLPYFGSYRIDRLCAEVDSSLPRCPQHDPGESRIVELHPQKSRTWRAAAPDSEYVEVDVDETSSTAITSAVAASAPHCCQRRIADGCSAGRTLRVTLEIV